MSGHNKFSKIKHKKEAMDAKKSKVFAGLVKQIAIESRAAKGDKNSPGLRVAIEKARAANMPADNIDRAVAKGAGLGAGKLEEFLCEAYGPGGVAIIIEGATESTKGTINEIKFTLSEGGATLGTQGSVIWAFTKTAESWEPNAKMQLSEEDNNNLHDLIAELEDNADVENVYTNAE